MKLQPSSQAAQHVDTCARQLAGRVRAGAVLLQLHSTGKDVLVLLGMEEGL